MPSMVCTSSEDLMLPRNCALLPRITGTILGLHGSNATLLAGMTSLSTRSSRLRTRNKTAECCDVD